MKKRIFPVLAAILAFLIVISAQSTWSSNGIEQLYIFGDSLSDVGNIFQLTEQQRPPSPPYYSGRYSNGRLWVEYLADELQLTPNHVTNLAWGGATTQGTIGNTVSLKKQIEKFLANHPNINSQALCIIWIGANDYLYGATNVKATVGNIVEGVFSLVNTGMKKFLIVNLPDLGKLPATRDTKAATSLSALTKAHNKYLSQSIQQLKQDLGPRVEIAEFDVYSVYQQVTRRPNQFGLTNVNDSCLKNSSVCQHPEGFLFWDGVHPSTAAHQILAKKAFSKVEEAYFSSHGQDPYVRYQ
ncbi:SGNH/GDSL hydrolase family protein [Gloeothece verrucosa]|uniref:Lipolytic protein G-D-S-L family n=1 Tax=Gloeothece verrucosa (strain PCC 7822) TaxID=497965 RepID=E0UK73_GLOV7|nr:SGNH/GDSL hydrolase family protein [Gloeothece verrucosa]ADN15835.1 lipolytic protein G-D-S-L family [Gloeothece verrucosa PCC 7822]